MPDHPEPKHSRFNPPPPPPLPPTSRKLVSGHSVHDLKFKNIAPPAWFCESKAPAKAPLNSPTGPYFFYGTLMDPGILAEVLNLDKKPFLRPGQIRGYTHKLWGQYPALLEDTTVEFAVRGMVYNVQSVSNANRLAEYETSNYIPVRCEIAYTDGDEPKTGSGHVFVFQGNVNDLSEGEFDLDIWLKNMGRKSTGVTATDAR